MELVAADRPRWGEIWCFAGDGGALMVHRCVGWRHGRARFWGDANKVIDPPVGESRWIGRVVSVRTPAGVERHIGAWERWCWGAVASLRHVVQYGAQWLRGRAASSSR